MTTHPEPTVVLDERGTRCPLPVIALGRAAITHPGEVIEVRSDDPAAEHDIPAWCRMRSAHYLGSRALDDGGTAYLVRVSAG